jgi:hypothetical protein
MEDCERRRTERYLIAVPVAFRQVKQGNWPKAFGRLLNISATGVCFSTHRACALSIVVPVAVFLKLPKEIMGSPSPEYCWTGHVTHIHTSGVDEVAMGVRFLFCDDFRGNGTRSKHVLKPDAEGSESFPPEPERADP